MREGLGKLERVPFRPSPSNAGSPVSSPLNIDEETLFVNVG